MERRPVAVGLGALTRLPMAARRSVLAVADDLLQGRARFFGVVRQDMVDPAWALDPVSRRTFTMDRSAFRIDIRTGADGGDVKQVWELSRHHHLTVLACAWRLTGDDRFAELVASHLRSWWRQNTVCSGVNWSSGIELGIRLISWVWTRRLLDGWSHASALFEENPVARHQVYWHQRYLVAFRSRGSSANNHVIAEAAGMLVASCGFDWFPESSRWRDEAAALLEHELRRNTFASGVNREQAFEYQGLVAELGLVAAAEAYAAGVPFAGASWDLLCKMVDATAAVLDRSGRPPRYGDGDEGRGLLLDDPAADRWRSLLALGAALFGPLGWWPSTAPDARSLLVASLVGRQVQVDERPRQRPSHFADAGLTILRSGSDAAEELWCRCDGGPHGYLSIAAHAHADALSIELRHDGVEVLADPGTYCYHSDPTWRRYFRSSLGHNTLELDGQDQSVPGGPFLWVRAARTQVLEVTVDRCGPQRWSAEHDGYERLEVPAIHRRTVVLDPSDGVLTIEDAVSSDAVHEVRLSFHLGPSVGVELSDRRARLCWERGGRGRATAMLSLPSQLHWDAHRGSTDPILGWYSAGFGRKQPITCLVGHGLLAADVLRTEVRFGAQG